MLVVLGVTFPLFLLEKQIRRQTDRHQLFISERGCKTDRKTDRWTDRKTDRHTERQTDELTAKMIVGIRWTDRKKDCQTDRWAGNHNHDVQKE